MDGVVEEEREREVISFPKCLTTFGEIGFNMVEEKKPIKIKIGEEEYTSEPENFINIQASAEDKIKKKK